ncbi:TAXI family TRAP transporter solute-binding subunit [Marinobacter pelagius]|uniref:TAXI family TRAP transporter solute-binding subunit n=1 Tax=Marinobacter sp. C7 TaxID=2951363 RepID=UPI001EF04090|nr:TAXI family TRAP transporter solute-binding subunit [Marinobacter sp. C7]MCG7200745.1 TAXI family TRAP transporter solute-binding subunit [Marinobacter sp. C7]
MRKLKTILVSAALGVGLAAGAAQAQERVFFGIATGGTGGTYYPLGGMLAQVISNNADLDGKKLSATAETGNASVANAGLLGRGDIESAFVAADILDSAYKGKNQFDGKAQKNLRALGALYPEAVQLVAQPGLDSVKDLEDKSVSSGSPGSGQWQLLGDLLKAHGMSRDDVNEDYSSFSQSAEKIKDGNLNASLITAGAPTASIVELANGHDINIIPLTGEPIKKLRETQPYYTSTVLPGGTYKGVNKDVETIAVRAIWATHADLPEDIAYAVTKALYENTETLGKVHVKGKEISVETALESVSIPLHPGAEKYFREKGIIE